MWVNNLSRNTFMLNLYKEVPPLKDVRIQAIKIEDEGSIVSLNFDMPIFADSPPKKWLQLGDNTVFVELDFFCISGLTIKSYDKPYRGDICIKQDKKGMLEVGISGSLDANFKAESGMVQSVRGYFSNKEKVYNK